MRMRPLWFLHILFPNYRQISWVIFVTKQIFSMISNSTSRWFPEISKSTTSLSRRHNFPRFWNRRWDFSTIFEIFKIDNFSSVVIILCVHLRNRRFLECRHVWSNFLGAMPIFSFLILFRLRLYEPLFCQFLIKKRKLCLCNFSAEAKELLWP